MDLESGAVRNRYFSRFLKISFKLRTSVDRIVHSQAPVLEIKPPWDGLGEGAFGGDNLDKVMRVGSMMGQCPHRKGCH